MDAFYAAVEQLDDPRLRGRPLLVGSDSARGVVLTASYEARSSGAGSAMPMQRARRLCPEALVVPPRFERYQQISALVMEALGGFSPLVEPLSLDEAFLDMTGQHAAVRRSRWRSASASKPPCASAREDSRPRSESPRLATSPKSPAVFASPTG